MPHLDFAGGEMVAMVFWWCCGWCRAAGVAVTKLVLRWWCCCRAAYLDLGHYVAPTMMPARWCYRRNPSVQYFVYSTVS
jgi:hypothetical protein